MPLLLLDFFFLFPIFSFFLKLEKAAVPLLNMFIRIFSIQLQLQMANIPSEY